MRLKKIAEKMRRALDTDMGEEKRAKKIGKLVKKLAKKKEKFKVRVAGAKTAAKKDTLKRKLAVCEAALAKGRKALVQSTRTDVVADKPPAITDPVKTTKSPPETPPQDKSIRH